jgi:peptide/nickel transport system ATP-binding protein
MRLVSVAGGGSAGGLGHVTACPFVDAWAVARPGGAETVDWAAAAPAVPGSVVLEAVGLAKDYRLARGGRGAKVAAVQDVSFMLRAGSVVALVGESGSGKTTIAKLLAGQERRTGGRILMDGATIDPSARRGFRPYKSEVQMVFQDPFASLNPMHTVRYHLQRALHVHSARTGRAASVNEVDGLLSQVRLAPAADFRDAYPHELSGGQRQRVSIARALAAAPRVLLADEPVSMLDVSIRLGILDLIQDLRTNLNLAVLYITHDIASARYFADEILVMHAGRIVERGPAEELIQRPQHAYTQLLIASSPDPDRFGTQLLDEEAAGPTDREGGSST